MSVLFLVFSSLYLVGYFLSSLDNEFLYRYITQMLCGQCVAFCVFQGCSQKCAAIIVRMYVITISSSIIYSLEKINGIQMNLVYTFVKDHVKITHKNIIRTYIVQLVCFLMYECM